MDAPIIEVEPGTIADESDLRELLEDPQPVDPLVALRSNYNASLEHQADVSERYNASFNTHKTTVEAVKAKLDEDWRKSNAELINEYQQVNNQTDKLKAKIQQTIKTEAEILIVADPKCRIVRKDLGFLFKAPDEVHIVSEQAAIEWSGKFLPMAVKTILDRSMFDGFVLQLPAAERPPCVTVRPKITAVIKNK